MNSYKVTAIGRTSHGLVRNVLHISEERSMPINDFINTAAQNPSRTATYIAETMSQVSEMCSTNEELAYAGYVIGVVMGATSELLAGAIDIAAKKN